MKILLLLCLAAVAHSAPEKGQRIEAGKPLACEAMLHKDACNDCCVQSFTGPLSFLEEPACHLTCGSLPNKRQLDLSSEARKLLACEAMLHKDACNACCDQSFSGLLSFAEKPTCHAACGLLPNKRQLVGEAAKFLACERESELNGCTSCCDASFTDGLLAIGEDLACKAACRLTHG